MENSESKSLLPQFPQEILKHTCQIFEVKNDEIKPRGSGVLVTTGKGFFLFSAAHVLEKRVLTNLRIETSIPLYGQLISNEEPESGSRERDPIDIAILKLEEEHLNLISSKYSFLPISKIWPGLYQNSDNELTISGYPSEFTEKITSGTELKSFKAKQVAFKTTMNSEKTFLVGGDETKTVKINYNQSSSTINSITGEPIQLPDPGAFSGSGIWSINPDKPNEYKLVAIATSFLYEPICILAGTLGYIFKWAITNHFK